MNIEVKNRNIEVKNRRTNDKETEELIKHAKDINIDISFTVLEKNNTCNNGSNGVCCRQCLMGPCNTVFGKRKGVCGADVNTVVARNLLMMVGRGTAAHASHSLHIALSLLKTAQDHTKIKDPEKLISVANKIKVSTSNGIENIAIQVASIAIQDILGTGDSMTFAKSYLPDIALEKIPRSVGRELLDAGHETSMGTMEDPKSLVLHAERLGIADITCLIIGTELQDVLFGKPRPVYSKIGFGILDEDKINIVVHGHFPSIAEKIIELSEDIELLNNAHSFGAKGINIVGCCCTGNEILMRHGIPLVGNSIQQELIIATGLVEAFVVDVQCIFPNIKTVANNFHTKIITTMKEARIANTEYIPFEEEYADEMARKILNIAIENFPKRRKGKIKDIFFTKEEPKDLIGGFSTENCLDILSVLNPEDPLKPLIDNIISGNIYGVVLLAGCLNPKVITYESHATLAKELMKKNILIIATGCAAGACARAGLLIPEASQYAGDKLKCVLKILGNAAGLEKPLPPVLFFGSCVDNSRAITLITAIAEKLNVPINDLPIAASAIECMAEKSIAIGIGAVALGITVHVGEAPNTIGSPLVTTLLTQEEELLRGKFIIESDPIKASQLLFEHISNMRRRLGLACPTNISRQLEYIDNEIILKTVVNAAMPGLVEQV